MTTRYKLSVQAGYHSEGAISPGKGHFYGRYSVMAYLGGLTYQAVLLTGARRIGKTSVLKHLENRMACKTVPVLFMDCTGANRDNFFNRVNREWGIQCETWDDLTIHLKKLNSKPVLIFDEYDFILQWELFFMDKAEFGEDQAISWQIRKLVQSQMARCIISGYALVNRSRFMPRHAFYNMATRHELLGPLTRDDLGDLLTVPMENMKVQYDPPGALHLLKECTMGNPSLAQEMAVRILDRIDNEGRPRLITMQLVQEAFEEDDIRQQLKAMLLKSVRRPVLLEFLLEHLDHSQLDPETAKKWFKQKKPDMTEDLFDQLWAELRLTGLVRWAEGATPKRMEYLSNPVRDVFKKTLDPKQELNAFINEEAKSNNPFEFIEYKI